MLKARLRFAFLLLRPCTAASLEQVCSTVVAAMILSVCRMPYRWYRAKGKPRRRADHDNARAPVHALVRCKDESKQQRKHKPRGGQHGTVFGKPLVYDDVVQEEKFRYQSDPPGNGQGGKHKSCRGRSHAESDGGNQTEAVAATTVSGNSIVR